MQNNPGIILQIQSTYNQLTKAEKKVADYVLEHQKEVIYMSITDLADACNVGDTSVFRFCRTMRLQGYQEFKMQLSLSLVQKDHYTDIQSVKDGEMELAEHLMQLDFKAIKETYMVLDRKMLDKIVQMIDKARRVYFFGVGDSGLTAEEARNKFLRITGKVCCISDPHMQSMAAATATEEDLIIIISYSGATKDNIHVAKEAKKAGVKIACITHFKKSPLTAYSDAILLCGADELPMEGGSMAVKMGQLYLIDLLYQSYYNLNKKDCREKQEKTVKSVL